MILFVNDNKGILFLSGATVPIPPVVAEREGGTTNEQKVKFRPYIPVDQALQLQRVREDEEILVIINTFIRSLKKWHL